MAQAQVRAFNPRGVVTAGAVAREIGPRMIRGYDAEDKVLFRVPASKLGRESARQAIDAKTVRDRHAGLQGRLARVEVDGLSGTPTEYVVAADGAMRKGYRIDGRLVAAFS